MSETIGQAVTQAAGRLASAGIDDARREARLLVALALEVEPTLVLGYPERPLPEGAATRLESFLTRRCAQEPFSRIKGKREFWSLDFALSPDTLDPRPDSETLIAAALEFLPDRIAPLRIIDFGTGSGCLLLALLSEFPHATGLGIDLLPGAAQMARRNAAALGLADRSRFAVSDWDGALQGEVEVIVSNPPYIASAEIDRLPRDVRCYEPSVALDGGTDGLAAYRNLGKAVARLLVQGGMAFFELGAGQAQSVAAILRSAGLAIPGIKHDLSGVERCIAVQQRR